MTKQTVIGSYLLRFVEKQKHRHIYLQDLISGETLEFESWVSVWAFLEAKLERYSPKSSALIQMNH